MREFASGSLEGDAEATTAPPLRRGSLPSRVPAAPTGRLTRFLLAAAPLAGVWWMLNPGDHASWIVGGPAVVAAAGTTLLFPAAPSYRPSPIALVRFSAYFAWQTVVGATDVALRALSPSLRLRPGFVEWRTYLPEGAPRRLFANAITLLPGTLTAQMDGDLLIIHVLDTEADPGLAPLEVRVGAIFRLNEGDTA